MSLACTSLVASAAWYRNDDVIPPGGVAMRGVTRGRGGEAGIVRRGLGWGRAQLRARTRHTATLRPAHRHSGAYHGRQGQRKRHRAFGF